MLELDLSAVSVSVWKRSGSAHKRLTAGVRKKIIRHGSGETCAETGKINDKQLTNATV